MRRDLAGVLSRWPVEVESIKPVKDVFLVRTRQGPKCLKLVRRAPERVAFMVTVADHLVRRGFESVCGFIRTVDGAAFLAGEEGCYVMSDWVEGRQCDFRKPHMLAGGTRTLAGFHRAASGCGLPPGTVLKRRWGKLPGALMRKCAELQAYKRWASGSLFKTTFDKRYLEAADHYIGLAFRSLAVLSGSRYPEVAARAEAERAVCHGDAAGRNFIMRDDGKVYVIDLDCVRLDMRLHDIYKLMRRTLKKVSWDEEVGRTIIEVYNSENPLVDEEYPVLYALLLFPQKFWRIANRYYDKHRDWEEARYVGKLEKHLSQKRQQARFLGKFPEMFPQSLPAALVSSAWQGVREHEVRAWGRGSA